MGGCEMRLKGKVAVITGGNSGIGLAIAKVFSEQGASIVISGRDKKTLEKARVEIGSETLALQSDISNLPEIDLFYQETSKTFGKIDVLVVNAGIAPVTPIEKVDEAFFDQISDINFKGAFFTVQKALPYLNDGASIILVSSIANQKGFAGMSVYSATKAAVRSLARAFSAELLPRGIRVNTLSPGAIETPIFGRMGLSKEEMEGFASNITTQIPMKRIGNSQEMANCALFLASSDSSYVAGSELIADGGLSQL